MQCASFLPGFFSSRDLTVGDNGGAWTLYNTEKILNNVHPHNVFSPLPSIDQFSVYEKEVLRQTILQHESIFRDQVRELHQLYRRQRELMDEIKRRMLSDRNLHSDSIAFVPKISSEAVHGTSQNPSLPWVNPTASRLPVSSAENFWSTSSFSELLRSKCEKPKKKMFDLELPAEEYIDSEEEDQFREYKVSEVSEMPCFPAMRIQEVSQKSDLERFPCHDPSSRRNFDLADLNEPLGLEVAVASNSMDLNMPPSGLLDSKISQKDVRTEDGVKKHEDLKAVLPATREKMQDFSNKPNEQAEDSSPRDLVFSQAFSTSVCDPEPKRFKTSDASDDKVDLYREVIADNSILKVVNQIDLNCCINEEKSSPELPIPVVTKTVAEIELEAPVSPENKECSPPRGESEENPLETPVKLPKQEEDGEHQINELVRMAAEAIVLISTPGFPKLLSENIVCERFEGSPSDSLDWFAEVVSSFAGDLEYEIGVVLGQELSSDGSDYFEAMTLELTEIRAEEYWCQGSVQKEEETSGVLSPSKPRRGRMRGKQRKNFQTEVLPSLSSLSGHEVTEDLQTIGGMMEAAGFLAGTSPGKRNGGRNVCSRARRRSDNSLCNGIENTVCSPMKQQNIDSCFALGERSLKGWGKVNRRRRGPRIPATSTPLVFG
ncbi:hypothetical protein RHGRI_024081 [Rhododendron griersonianum]|uniref:Uncharacterized protein n=1 Tax=Rhododendron griersonianum TaxID=479676 RepID=A0AAV6J773_9ERIC|nr:hypothetical protein RHGRI_024081 [Rhododendron griersonianum]